MILSSILLVTLAFAVNADYVEIDEEFTVNLNKVSQALSDLQNGTSHPGHRLTIDYVPMNCQARRIEGVKYMGNVVTSGNWIETEAICVSVCWQYASQGYPCKSVNYIKSKSTCELMMDAYVNSGLVSDPSSSYIVPTGCSSFGQATNPPTAPPNTPPPTSAGGNTGSIQPGSCGQATVAQRFSRAVLAGRPGTRIVGGTESRQHSVPYIVSLRQWGGHYCGGTLVRVSPNREESDIIITASHCMGSPNFDVVAGAHYRNRPVKGEQSVPAVQVVKHPRYGYPSGTTNDIAIVKLARPIKFSDTIQPACLPAGRHEAPRDGQNGIVAGWGALRENDRSPDQLMQVMVPVISSQKCNMMYGNIDDSMLCAGYDAGQKDACQGDSGGPYVIEGKNGYTLVGVVSWGSGCAQARAPGVYAHVANFADWIQTTIKSISSIRD